MSPAWYDVLVTLDEDEVAHYAVEALDAGDARNIALERVPDLDTKVELLGAHSVDEVDALDGFDEVIELDT